MARFATPSQIGCSALVVPLRCSAVLTPKSFLNAATFMASGVACGNTPHDFIIHVMENYLAFKLSPVKASDAAMEKARKMPV